MEYNPVINEPLPEVLRLCGKCHFYVRIRFCSITEDNDSILDIPVNVLLDLFYSITSAEHRIHYRGNNNRYRDTSYDVLVTCLRKFPFAYICARPVSGAGITKTLLLDVHLSNHHIANGEISFRCPMLSDRWYGVLQLPTTYIHRKHLSDVTRLLCTVTAFLPISIGCILPPPVEMYKLSRKQRKRLGMHEMRCTLDLSVHWNRDVIEPFYNIGRTTCMNGLESADLYISLLSEEWEPVCSVSASPRALKRVGLFTDKIEEDYHGAKSYSSYELYAAMEHLVTHRSLV